MKNMKDVSKMTKKEIKEELSKKHKIEFMDVPLPVVALRRLLSEARGRKG